MTDVKRYSPNPNHNEVNAMNEREAGDYVLFDDYQALQAENEQLKCQNSQMSEMWADCKQELCDIDDNEHKLKADAVREAAQYAQDKSEKTIVDTSGVQFALDAVEDYANKLEN